MKEYKKLVKELKKQGFRIEGSGNHHFVIKNNIKVLITKNVRDSQKLCKIVLKQYESGYAKSS